MGNFTETFEFGAIYTAAGFTAPAFGQSSFAGSGINLLDMLIDDGPMATRNSTFGWMPLSYANDASQAQEKLVAHVQLAMEKSLDVMGLDYSRIEHDDTTFIGFYVHNKDLYCPMQVKKEKWHTGYFFHPVRNSACVVRASINMPHDNVKTADVRMKNHSEARSYKFTSRDKKNFNAILVSSPANSSLLENQIYNEISKNLPKWMFIYLAPGKVKLSSGKTINFAYLLNQGKASFFIRPD